MPRSVMQMRPSNPSLWEERIEARGQHVLWYSATSCYCVSDGGRVDPNCPRCFGKGFVYNPVRSTRQITWGMTDGRETIDVSPKGIVIKNIFHVYVGANQEVPIQMFTPTSFTPATPLMKGLRYTLDFEANFELNYTGACNYVGQQLIDVPVRLMNNQNYFAGQLISVASLRNVTRDSDVLVVAFWANKILTASKVDEADELIIDCQYVKASKFLVTSINPKTKLETNLVLQNADAMMAFPGTYHVGRGDIILLQMAEVKETIVGINEGRSYIFPYSSIARILSVEDKSGPITDYTLIRDNEIMWGSRIPQRFACSFTYHPAFSVLEDLPSVRYSEDKIFPKRVFLRKFSTFTHGGKVLTMENPNINDTGLLDDPNEDSEQGGLL